MSVLAVWGVTLNSRTTWGLFWHSASGRSRVQGTIAITQDSRDPLFGCLVRDWSRNSLQSQQWGLRACLPVPVSAENRPQIGNWKKKDLELVSLVAHWKVIMYKWHFLTQQICPLSIFRIRSASIQDKNKLHCTSVSPAKPTQLRDKLWAGVCPFFGIIKRIVS